MRSYNCYRYFIILFGERGNFVGEVIDVNDNRTGDRFEARCLRYAVAVRGLG